MSHPSIVTGLGLGDKLPDPAAVWTRRVEARRDVLGVVLAGGLATRLGPLGLQVNKALVPVGQRPLLAHQLRLFLHLGIRQVVIVTRPEWQRQLAVVVERCFNLPELQIDIMVQERSLGPGPALGGVVDSFPGSGQLLVFLADTYVEPDDLPVSCDDWVGVGGAPCARRWCAWDGQRFVEHHVEKGAAVAVGVYGFGDRESLHRATAIRPGTGEGDLASVLNRYAKERALQAIEMPSWQDFGDLTALSTGASTALRCRANNKLVLTERGTVVKSGHTEGFQAQTEFFRHLDAKRSVFFPRLVDVDRWTYELDYLDLPTLAQLYLYWPALPSQWADIVANIVDSLARDFWPLGRPMPAGELADRCERMYERKLRQRFAEWQHPLTDLSRVRLNGEELLAGTPLLDEMIERLRNIGARGVPAYLHGDLNFSNILYSLGSGSFRLLDPRGEWGGYGPIGDLRYEFAKLRYSYHGNFNAICDGLFDLRFTGQEATLHFGVHRTAEIAACDEVLQRHVDIREIHLLEAYLLLSAIPLHADDREQQLAFYLQGVRLANEVLDD